MVVRGCEVKERDPVNENLTLRDDEVINNMTEGSRRTNPRDFIQGSTHPRHKAEIR